MRTVAVPGTNQAHSGWAVLRRRQVACTRSNRNGRLDHFSVRPQHVSNAAVEHQSSEDAPGCSGRDHEPVVSASQGRRGLLAGVAALTTALTSTPAAQAIKAVTLRDGTVVQATEHSLSLSIVALRGSFPNQWVMDFRSILGKYSGFSLDQRKQIVDIFQELESLDTKNTRLAANADVVSLGDAWLAPAIQRGLIQPIPNAEQYRWYKLLSPRWRALLRRNAAGVPDPRGAMYGAPYRWGCTLIAYRPDRLLRRGGEPIKDWSDLLQPALEGRVAFLESGREFVAIALKSMGLSANTSGAQLAAAGISEEQLAARVSALRKQAKLFSSNDHIRALNAGDVWAVVGYSIDIVQLAERGGAVEIVAPLSGTQLWADVWSVPSRTRGVQGAFMAAPSGGAFSTGGPGSSGISPLLPSWLEFCLAKGRLIGSIGLKAGAPPLLLPEAAPLGTPRPEAPHFKHSAHSGLPTLRPWLDAALEASRSMHRAIQSVQNKLTTSSSGTTSSTSTSVTNGTSTTAGADSAMTSSAAVRPSPQELYKIEQATGYLPSAPVMARSEFLEPLDAETTALYGRVLLGASRGDVPAAVVGPGHAPSLAVAR